MGSVLTTIIDQYGLITVTSFEVSLSLIISSLKQASCDAIL